MLQTIIHGPLKSSYPIWTLDFYFRQRNRAEILYRIELKLLAKDPLKEERIGVWPDNIAFP